MPCQTGLRSSLLRTPRSLALSACLLATPLRTPLLAQAAPGSHPRRTSAAASSSAGTQATSLPVTHVSLYKNGVGFFEHTGRIAGDQTVTLDLTSTQLNDALQSLTAIDLGGGRITGAGYNSTTPLDQQLRALPLSLGEQPTEQDLFNSLRGARVEVTGWGAAFTGRILSLELRPVPSADVNARPAPERRFLTVVADTGAMRTLELTSSTVIRLLDTPLRTDLKTYLELLDRNRSEGIRHLALTDHGPAGGSAPRELRVSFLSEVPVWKSTYRILFTDPTSAPGTVTAPTPSSAGQTATVQGFSVIDNTTGEDWNNVHLSLIAGSPQSFLQPLAQPIYARRPEIPIAQDAQLTPQTHDAAVDALASPTKIPKDIQMFKEDGAPPPSTAGIAGRSSMGEGSGGAMGGGSGVPGGVLGGIGPETVGSMGGGVRRIQPQQRVRNQSLGLLQPYETIAVNSTNPNTTTAAFDDFFAYNLTDPVTIPRNGSALVPILQTPITSERVTLWSPSEPVALRALWITNSSALTLDRGSFTIVENGNFGGEGLLDMVHPGERRLLSYAADQAVRVTADDRRDTRRVTALSISKGVLKATSAEIAEVEYLVTNAAPDPRTVIVEQPRRQGWTLESNGGQPTSDPKPTETTPAAYRFRVVTGPKETMRLHIGERHSLDEFFRLVDSREDQLALFLHNAKASPALLLQLEPVFAAKRAVTSVDDRLREKQAAIDQLVDDQKRLRDNLAALKGSSEERALARRYTAELNTQEDTLTALRRDLAALHSERQRAEADLSQKIDALQVSETTS